MKAIRLRSIRCRFPRTVRPWPVAVGTRRSACGMCQPAKRRPPFEAIGNGSLRCRFPRMVRPWPVAVGTAGFCCGTWRPISPPLPRSKLFSSSPSLPAQTALLANYPNPFNPDTWIPFQLHAPAPVRLSIYDVRGALIREIEGGHRAAGQYLTSGALRWAGRDQRGQRVASGVYLYRLQAGRFAQVRRMLLVK